MTKFTEREVRDRIKYIRANGLESRGGFYLCHVTHRDIELLTQLADMLAEREKADPYCYTCEQKNGLSQGAMCRTRYECEMSPLYDPEQDHIIPLFKHPAAQPRGPDGYVMVPVNDDNWPPMPVIRAMLDCQDADPEDGTESEAYYGLRAAIKEWAGMLAAQESGR